MTIKKEGFATNEAPKYNSLNIVIYSKEPYTQQRLWLAKDIRALFEDTDNG
jgi:hypothetical protein